MSSSQFVIVVLSIYTSQFSLHLVCLCIALGACLMAWDSLLCLLLPFRHLKNNKIVLL